MSGFRLEQRAGADGLADMAPGTVDMVYSDPPFGNRQVWKGKAGEFSDRWTWDAAAAAGWSALHKHNLAGGALLGLMARDENARGYLGVMAGLLLQVRRSLRPTGTLWLHFDDTMGAELRVLGDAVFGPENAVGTIIWRRSSAHATTKGFGRVHDTIACYARTRVARWRLARCRSELAHGDPMSGLLVDGVLEDRLSATAAERIGYPTQKPVALIERFIRAATLPGDLVADPTCGSGTTLVAALGLGRRALGFDISADAIKAAHGRLDARPPQQADLFGQAA